MISVVDVINRLLMVSLFLIPYYVFPSGSFQPAHIFLLLFSISVFFLGLKHKKSKFILNSNSFFVLALFFIYIVFVNIVYAFLYEDIEFLRFVWYTIFNLIVYFSISNFVFNFYDSAAKSIFSIFIVVNCLLLILWGLGLGEYKFGFRYNGFFNDPNQMAFFVLCSMSICFALLRSNIVFLIFFAIGSVLIFATISRSALLGLVLIVISYLIFFVDQKRKNSINKSKSENFKKIIYILFKLLLFVLFIFIFFSIPRFDSVINMLDRMQATDVTEQVDVRGYTRIITYPEYLLFGAGQGLDQRFNSVLEIHSTWGAVLFYYGIVGLSLFVIFLWGIFKNLNLYQKVLFLAPMAYGFSTLSIRTTVFWILLSIFHVISIKNRLER